MLRRLLLTTILATTALANAQGDADPTSSFGVLTGSTITCSGTSTVAGCYLEKPVLTLGDLEVTLGVDAQVAYGGGRAGHLAPYVGAAWYGPTYSVWGELFMPHSNVPIVGRSDWFRVGFTWRIE